MNKELLNVIVEFKETNKVKECPVEIDSILWDYLNDNLILGKFSTPDFKYVFIETAHWFFEFYKSWVCIECTPIIYDEKGNDLKEKNIDEYLEHEDFWRAIIKFEVPDHVIVQSTNISSIKYGYEVFCNVVEKGRDPYKDLRSPHRIGIFTDANENKSIRCDEDCPLVSIILDDFDNFDSVDSYDD
jgi:hypothetical protein